MANIKLPIQDKNEHQNPPNVKQDSEAHKQANLNSSGIFEVSSLPRSTGPARSMSLTNTFDQSLFYSNEVETKKGKAKMVLPVSDVQGLKKPIQDIILRAGNNFALRVFENQPQRLVPSFAGSVYSSGAVIEVNPILPSSKIFTDIFPNSNIYRGIISSLWSNWEEFCDFLRDNEFYLGFLIFLYNELLTNLAYQSSLLALSVVSLVEEVPSLTNALVRKYYRMVRILANKQLRGMWWLNVTTDIKILLRKITKIARSIWMIASKFYLISMLVVCVGFLQTATPRLTTSAVNNLNLGHSMARESVLEQLFIQNSVPSPNGTNLESSSTGYSLLLTSDQEVDESAILYNCIIEYQTKEGDTLEDLAALYNISIETIANNNALSSGELEANQKLQIPCTDAIIYTIREGDSLEEIAQRYGLETITISSLNSEYLASSGFKSGGQILIPGISFEDYEKINSEIEAKQARTAAEAKALAQREEAKAKQIASKKKLIQDAESRAKANNVDLESSSCGLIWPTTTKNISQYPSKVHMAIDISNRSLPDIFAAANGKVVFAGWDDSGYGNMILIDHGDGLKTRYAHNKKSYVSVGDYVTQGQSIAQMGSTGRSTGPHLHFEVIQNGKLTNPLSCY